MALCLADAWLVLLVLLITSRFTSQPTTDVAQYVES